MKKFLLTLGLLMAATTLQAKEFDSVFNTFKDTPKADYVKMPGLLLRMGVSGLVPSEAEELPLKMKITGLKVLDMESCSKEKKAALDKAVNDAGKRCELMLEAADGNDKATIWLEPKGKTSYSKMIIYDASDASLVELSGKFTPSGE